MIIVKGWLIGWRNAALSSVIVTVACCLLIFFIPSSSHWLFPQDKIDKGERSLKWFDKCHKTCQNKSLEKEQKRNNTKLWAVFFGLFVCQHMSGSYIILFYSVELFKVRLIIYYYVYLHSLIFLYIIFALFSYSAVIKNK